MKVIFSRARRVGEGRRLRRRWCAGVRGQGGEGEEGEGFGGEDVAGVGAFIAEDSVEEEVSRRCGGGGR